MPTISETVWAVAYHLDTPGENRGRWQHYFPDLASAQEWTPEPELSTHSLTAPFEVHRETLLLGPDRYRQIRWAVPTDVEWTTEREHMGQIEEVEQGGYGPQGDISYGLYVRTRDRSGDAGWIYWVRLDDGEHADAVRVGR